MNFKQDDLTFIQSQYRVAADKKRQVLIFSQLFCCSKSDIYKVLGIKGDEDTEKKEKYRQLINSGFKKSVAAQKIGISKSTAYYWSRKMNDGLF